MASSQSKPLLKPLSNSLFNSLFRYEFTTRIHDIDAAGVMFFARSLYHAHDAYEAFLNHHGLSIASMLKSDFILPISHTEADFKTPVLLNEVITIEIVLHEIKEDGFSLNYQFINHADKICSTALTSHVCLDSNTHKRRNLPESVQSILSYNE